MKDLFFLNQDITTFEKVIIYGAGWAGRNMLFKLLQQNVKVYCFADSDPEKCGMRLLNIPVIHIDELNSECKTAAVIVSGRYAFTVAEKLTKRGFIHLFLDYGNDAHVIHIEREGH